MTLPTNRAMMVPLLHFIAAQGGTVVARNAYGPLADYFALSREERTATHASNPNSSIWNNRVCWTREALKLLKLLRAGGRGVWEITEAGKEALIQRGLAEKPFPSANAADYAPLLRVSDAASPNVPQANDRVGEVLEQVSSREPPGEPVSASSIFDADVDGYPEFKETCLVLLHYVESRGGVVMAQDAYGPLADYFCLSSEHRQARVAGNPPNAKWRQRVQFSRQRLCREGYLQSGGKGVWRITRSGQRELEKHGLLHIPFAARPARPSITTLPSSDAVEQVVKAAQAGVIKSFPKDFLPNSDGTDVFVEVELPPVRLRRDTIMPSVVLAPGLTFRYNAKNPAEAAYILYAHRVGVKSVAVPKNTLIMFKAVKAYEAYVRQFRAEILELLLDVTREGQHAVRMAQEAAQRLGLPEV